MQISSKSSNFFLPFPDVFIDYSILCTKCQQTLQSQIMQKYDDIIIFFKKHKSYNENVALFMMRKLFDYE